jgi:hypothetical protein
LQDLIVGLLTGDTQLFVSHNCNCPPSPQLYWPTGRGVQLCRPGFPPILSNITFFLCQYCLLRFFCVWTFFFKAPKREIFDRSDFPDFYTIKSLRVGDFGVKIKKMLQNI